MNNAKCIVAIAVLAMTFASPRTAMQAQTSAPSWSGAGELGRWNLVGRRAAETPRVSDGILVNLDGGDGPVTIHSPRFSVSKKIVSAIDIRYLANIVTIGEPVLNIAWLDDKLSEEAAEACMRTVPIQVASVTTLTVQLASFRCWNDEGALRELALNFDQPNSEAVGTVQLLSVRVR